MRVSIDVRLRGVPERSMQKPEPNGGRDVQFCRGALADERRCHGQRNEPPRLATLGGDKGGKRDRSSLYRCPCRRRPARCGRVSRRCSRRVSHFRRIAPVRPARARDAASSLVFLVGLVLVATRGSNTIRGVLWLGGGLLLGAMIFWIWVVWVRQVHRHAVARFGPRLGTELKADRAE